MVAPEQAIVGGPAAGAQEQGHGDAERLLEERQHPGGLPETAGPHGAHQGLARLVGEGGEQLVEAQVLQRLAHRGAADAGEAELQAFLRDRQGLGQLGVADGIREMVLEILKRRGDGLERAVAGGRGRKRDGGRDLDGGERQVIGCGAVRLGLAPMLTPGAVERRQQQTNPYSSCKDVVIRQIYRSPRGHRRRPRPSDRPDPSPARGCCRLILIQRPLFSGFLPQAASHIRLRSTQARDFLQGIQRIGS